MIWVENGNARALLGIYDVKSHFKLSERLGLAKARGEWGRGDGILSRLR